jgi:hypothetical protein
MSRVLITILSLSSLLLNAPAGAKPINQCASSVTTTGGVLLVCPQGDGPTLADIGATIDFVVMVGSDPVPYPSHAMPPSDIWVSSMDNRGLLCRGSYSSDADDWLDENGHGTISGSIAASGYADRVYVVAAGMAIQGTDECDNPIPLVLVSPDIDGDSVVNLGDVGILATGLTSGGHDPRIDFNGDGVLNVVDLSMFAEHYLHRCEE